MRTEPTPSSWLYEGLFTHPEHRLPKATFLVCGPWGWARKLVACSALSPTRGHTCLRPAALLCSFLIIGFSLSSGAGTAHHQLLKGVNTQDWILLVSINPITDPSGMITEEDPPQGGQECSSFISREPGLSSRDSTSPFSPHLPHLSSRVKLICHCHFQFPVPYWPHEILS